MIKYKENNDFISEMQKIMTGDSNTKCHKLNAVNVLIKYFSLITTKLEPNEVVIQTSKTSLKMQTTKWLLITTSQV